jgi:SAM-dependent methyltransferase
MGPNAVLMVSELCDGWLASDTSRVCDLGCGNGLTSLWLAENVSGTVYACDLWNEATENRDRFEEQGLGDRIEAVHADALGLPFSTGFFDALVSVDSYNYFGREEGVIDRVAACVAHGAPILLSVPGLVRPLDDEMMETFSASWTREQMEYLWCRDQWAELLGKSGSVHIEDISEMACFDAAWDDWLTCDNEYAQGDRAAIAAGAGSLMNLLAIRLSRK